MGLDASRFIRSRKRKSAITEKRIINILNAVIDSYHRIKQEKIVFDYSTRGKIKQEDFLRNRFVDDFLHEQLNKIAEGTYKYIATKDAEEEYRTIIDNVLHNDPIDIHITIINLTDFNNAQKAPYFAIECKRFTSGSISAYLGDIKKFTERSYTQTRLSFEGQIGFIENADIASSKIVQNLNNNLSLKTSPINTLENINPYLIQEKFPSSYKSKHRKLNKIDFEIFHLFLDYSDIVIRDNTGPLT